MIKREELQKMVRVRLIGNVGNVGSGDAHKTTAPNKNTPEGITQY